MVSHNRCAALIAVLVGLVLSHAASATAAQTVIGERFVVTSGHPEATAAGVAVLRAGGNVADAAVATSLALGVAEPYGSGIGGKGMLLYRDGKTGRVYAIEAMGTASAALDARQFAERPKREREYGYTSVAVPGLVALLDAMHQRWGTKPWRELALPAAELAERGVTVLPKMHQLMRPKRSALARDDEAARLYLVDGQTPPISSQMKNSDLAHSLRLIADEGPRAFYDGQIAARIVAAAEEAGAPLTVADFREYQPQWSEPLVVDFAEHRVYSSPPPLTGGTTVLATLRGVDGVAALDTTDGRDPRYIDLVGRILLSIYPRVSRTIADVPTAAADAEKLFADKTIRRIQQEAEAAEPAEADREPARTSGTHYQLRYWLPDTRHPPPDTHQTSTTHLIVADRDGNIACLTQSLSYHFGACVVAPGTGIVLNNSMSNFATGDPQGCNYVAPGKRERSTIAPVIVMRDERPVLALGIPGGQRIPTTTVQLLTDVLHFGTPLEEAFDRPRFHVRRPVGADEAANVVDLEDEAPPEFDEQLAAMGWQPKRHNRDGGYFGGGSAVMYRADGTMQGVADTRRTNSADGE